MGKVRLSIAQSGILIFAFNLVLINCLPDLETSGVPTFFDPKYHDDGSNAEPNIAEYTPVESIHSPAYVSFTQLDNIVPPAVVNYPIVPVYEEQQRNQAKDKPFGKAATIIKSEGEYYFADKFTPANNQGGHDGVRDGQSQLQELPTVIEQSSNSGFIQPVSSSKVRFPSQETDEYKSVPLLEAAAPPSSTVGLNVASVQNTYSIQHDEPQQYYPGAGWKSVSPSAPTATSPPSPVTQGYVNYFPASEHQFASGFSGNGGARAPEPTKATAFHYGFIQVKDIRPSPSPYPSQPSPKPLNTHYTTETQRPLEVQRYPQQYLEPEYPLPLPPTPSTSMFRPLSSLYESLLGGIKSKIPSFSDGATVTKSVHSLDAAQYGAPAQEYGKPSNSFSVSEDEYKAYLNSEAVPSQQSGYSSVVHQNNKPYSSPFSSLYSLGDDEDRYAGYAPMSPYYNNYKAKATLEDYFRKKRPNSSFGYGSYKPPVPAFDNRPTKGSWDWKAQSYGTPYDLVSKGSYRTQSSKNKGKKYYRTRNNGWSQPAPVLAPMNQGYRYKYSTMYHPGTVRENGPAYRDDMENGPQPEELEEEEEESNLEEFDCENRQSCTPAGDKDVAESVDLTRRRKPKRRRIRFGNDLFKRLIKNIAGKGRRRRPPPPPPPSSHKKRRDRPCRGRRCPPPSKTNKVTNITVNNYKK